MADRAIALYGTAQPVPERVELRAGPVTATLEDGALRWIRYEGAEVLRALAFLWVLTNGQTCQQWTNGPMGEKALQNPVVSGRW